MKGILFVMMLLVPFLGWAVDPTLDAERRSIIKEFLYKTQDSYQYALSNLTTYGYYNNGVLDFAFCTDVTGCFNGILAQDYYGVVFTEVPIQTPSGIVYKQFSIIKFGIPDTGIYYVDTYPEGDHYVANYYINATQLDFATGNYDEGDGITYRADYIFYQNTTKLMSEVVSSLLGSAFFNSAAGTVSATQLCSGIVGITGVLNGACPVGSSYQQFSSIDDCLTKMYQVVTVAATSICPDVLTTNSTACRNIHYVTALANPPQSQIDHCPHVQVPSPVCIDRCVTQGCGNCTTNSQCIFQPTVTGQRTYFCQCLPGYVGDGYTSCVIKNCTAQWQCGSGNSYNLVTCTNGVCGCANTFVWNATIGTCQSPPNTNLIYQNGVALALPIGRCFEQWHCASAGLGDYNSMQCITFGTNAYVPYNSCICNYGYDGNFNVPCTCASGKTVTWSSTLNGNVCLYSDECTASYDCTYPQTCNLTIGGYPGVVGVCQ